MNKRTFSSSKATYKADLIGMGKVFKNPLLFFKAIAKYDPLLLAVMGVLYSLIIIASLVPMSGIVQLVNMIAVLGLTTFMVTRTCNKSLLTFMR